MNGVVGELDAPRAWGGVASSLGFGLLIGVATYVLHGFSLFERATNSATGWILWTSVAGAAVTHLLPAMTAGAAMMVGACLGYYAVTAAADLFGVGALPTAIVWLGVGIVTGPAMAWAGWQTRRSPGWRRHVGVAMIGGVVLAEAGWMGFILGYWGEAVGFAVLGVALTVALCRYRSRDIRRWWLPFAIILPITGAMLAGEVLVLGTLL